MTIEQETALEHISGRDWHSLWVMELELKASNRANIWRDIYSDMLIDAVLLYETYKEENPQPTIDLPANSQADEISHYA